MAVLYEVRDRVAVVVIDRQERRNAVDRETAVALGDAWRRFEADDTADVAVLWGRGGVFSAGADLKTFDLVDDDDGFLGFTRTVVGKPTIAAIEGFCVAGGLEMALWCDLRIAGESAVFGCLERRFGVPLVDGATQRLPRIVGTGRALDMILTGRQVPAEEALEMGLVNALVEDGTALEESVSLARRITRFPQETVRSDRRSVLEGSTLPLDEGLERERRLGLKVLDVGRRGAARFAAGEGRAGGPVRPVVISVVRGDAAVPEETETDTGGPAAPWPGRSGIRSRLPGDLDAYMALPRVGAGRPVLVIHDRQGLTPGALDAADTLSQWGYVAVAPRLFEAVEDPRGLDPHRLARLMLGAVGAVIGDERVVGEAVGVLGFGIGGGLASWIATLDPQIRACVEFGGYAPWDDVHPVYRQASAAFLGHHAERDERSTTRVAYGLETRLRDLGLDATFHAYPGVDPGFWESERPGHHPTFSELAWERTRLFLDRHL